MNHQTKFKQTEIGMIPEDWKVKEFGDFIKVQNGFAFKSSDFKVKGIPIIKIKNITTPTITFEEVQYYNEDFDDKLKPFILQKGDIIISMTGSNVNQMASAVGKVARYKSDLPALLNQRAGKIIIDSNIADSDYIYFYTTRKKIQYYLAINAAGSANQANISPDTIKSIPIALPSLSEQRVIAKILSDLDEKIELNQRMNKTLEAIGQAIFKHWFVNFEFPNENGEPYKFSCGEMVDCELGLIPKGWEIKKVGEILKTVLGGTPSRKKKIYWENGKIPWINSGKVNDYRIIEPSEYITELGLEKSSTKLLPKRTTVIAITGATLGKISLLEIDCYANQSIIGIVENNIFKGEYIYFWMKNIINRLIAWQTGGAQQHVNKDNVNKVNILIPNEKILQKYYIQVRPIFNKISSNCFENKNLQRLRDLLLPKLMSGEIRVPINSKNFSQLK